MEDKKTNFHQDEWLKDIPLRSESEGYEPEEMIICQKCRRKSPPTRLDCIYCGIELKFEKSESQRVKPVLRKIESYEKGFNLIYLANLKNWNELQFSEVGKMTRLNKNHLQQLVEINKPVPLARVENKKEVEIVGERLSELGIETKIIKDTDFNENFLPARLRRIEFSDEKLIFILFNNDEIVNVKNENINLIVVGKIFEKKLESTEKHLRKKENKILDIYEISSNELLIDIYTKIDPVGYRISQKGFDFSCLGEDKRLLAAENMKILISKMKDFATNAEIDSKYEKTRVSLSQIWEIEERKDFNLKRKSLGSFNRENITTTNNILQFTKYSRLQWILKNKR